MNLEKMELGKELDKALYYTAYALSKTGTSSKPVLLHSFKVANKLYELDYKKEIVISAALHDLIEDTAIIYEDIKNEFSEEIANIVKCVSFNPKIEDHLEQAKMMFNECLQYNGNEALLVKCSDLVDNIDYVQFVSDLVKKNILLKKYELFLNVSKERIGETELYKTLLNKFNENK